MKIPEQIKDFLYFTKGERNGISLLIILIFLVVITLILYPYFNPQTKSNFTSFQKEIEEFEKSLKKSKNKPYTNRLNRYIENKYDSLDLFYFDPNTTSSESFKKLGLTDKQIATLNNYLNKGGRFYVKDDFRKIYGIRNYQYLKLKPFILLADKINNDEYSNKKNFEETTFSPDSLFFFDPNTTSNEKWATLGLKGKQVKTIKNYLSKGGVFYNKEDFKKIYGITDNEYAKLEPFIKIEKKKSQLADEKVIYIELNSTTAEELAQINVIPDYLAKKIITYREKLGGFIQKEQLLEIKNFYENIFKKISPQLTVNSKKVKRISLNFSEIKDFVSHPYLNYHQAKTIVQYRTENGPYQSINALLENKILAVGTFNKIKPYLSVN